MVQKREACAPAPSSTPSAKPPHKTAEVADAGLRGKDMDQAQGGVGEAELSRTALLLLPTQAYKAGSHQRNAG